MRCINCHSTEHWINVDEFRMKPKGMMLCQECGFVTFKGVKSHEDMKNYYHQEYRKDLSVGNWFTGERKLHYHMAFLQENINEWKKSKKKVRIFEIGSAFGMLVNALRMTLPDARVGGSEWNGAAVANAKYWFNIDLIHDLPDDQKQDMIISYKVIEHQRDADKEILKYHDKLNEGGLLYISVPVWFEKMTNFGLQGFDIEYYYHPDHINVWTRAIFESLVERAGFEKIRENHTMYDSTYLYKKVVRKEYTPFKHGKGDIPAIMKRIKTAYEHFLVGNTDEAIKEFPFFPIAYQSKYESNRAKLHKIGYDNIKETFVVPMLNNCQTSADVRLYAADIAMRYSKWEDGLNYLNQALLMVPNMPVALKNISIILRNMAREQLANGDADAALQSMVKSRNTCRFLHDCSFQDRVECMTWIMRDNNQISKIAEMVKTKKANTKVPEQKAE